MREQGVGAAAMAPVDDQLDEDRRVDDQQVERVKRSRQADPRE